MKSEMAQMKSSGSCERQRIGRQLPAYLIAFSKCLLVLLVLLPQTLVAQNTFDDREKNLVSGLRDRALFDLAESHCSKFLTREGLTASDQAAIAIERISTKTAQARTAVDRESHWKAVDEIASTFFTSQNENPKSVLVGLQQALAHVAFASRLQQELEAKIGGEQARELGLLQLALAREGLDRTRQQTIDTLQAQANQTITADMLTNEQLRTLKTNLEYQQAVVNLTSAQLADRSTEAGRLDRIDSLGRVPDQLASVRGAVVQSSPVWWRTWIQEAACRRMLGDLNTAEQILKPLESTRRPKSVDAMLLREKVELAIAVGDNDRMQQLADRSTKQRHDPETEVALIRLLVAAGDIDNASKLVRNVTNSYGPWWARRADIALLSGSGSSPKNTTGNAAIKSASLGLLAEAAAKAEKNGDLVAAAEGYMTVAQSQFSEGDRSGGLTTTVRAALVLEKQKLHGQAAEILLKPSRAYPQETASPSIFLRGCWNLSRAKSPNYGAELEAMIRTWPQSKSADQARYWLSASLATQKKYPETFQTLLSLQPGFAQMPTGVLLARSAARRQLLALQSAGKPTRNLARKLNGDWSDFFRSRLESNQPAVALAMAELSLGWSAEDQSKTLQRMQSLDGLPQAKGSAEFQYYFAMLNDGQAKDRLAKAESLPFDSSTVIRLLDVIERMEDSKQIGEIELRIAGHALAQSNDAKTRRRFQNAQASALVTLGRGKEAEAIYREIIEADPKNQGAIVELARILDGEQALKQWRSIASRTTAHTKVWYESKLNVARLLHESGKSPEAAKMLKYIKAVPPGWEKSELKTEFETLLLKSSK